MGDYPPYLNELGLAAGNAAKKRGARGAPRVIGWYIYLMAT